MSLTIVNTTQEQLVGPDVVRALHEGVAQTGSAVLLVPSFAQALDAQRTLANVPGLALSVTTTTPSAWASERWEVWGDGRSLANGTALMVLARAAILRALPGELGPLRLSEGLVSVLASLVGQACPWLPLTGQGEPDASACSEAGLTHAETLLVGLAGKMRAMLAERGYIAAAEMQAMVPRLLQEAGALVPHIVLAGFSSMGRASKELVCGLCAQTQVTLVAQVGRGPASQQAESLVSWFVQRVGAVSMEEGAPAQALPRDAELSQLREALFGDARLEATGSRAVEVLLPAGPVAEAEVVARRVEELARQDGLQSIAVAVPDVARARRELVPKLVARGLSVCLSESHVLVDCPAAQAFFAYAETVAHLAELDATWPQPVDGLDGRMAQLGDMSWWPPRELTDFLLSDIAHTGAARAWWSDAAWRGNRLLSPGRLLEALQSERDTSGPVARATAELLRGRMGTAASKLLAPYVEALSQGEGPADQGADEARAVLQAILQLAGNLRELGVTTDPAVEGAVSLAELVECAEWAATGMAVVTRQQIEAGEDAKVVRLLGTAEAARLAPASVDALVLCGQTTVEQPITAGDDLLSALLEQMGVEPKDDPMARARANFHATVSAPRHLMVLERALHDSDAKPTYPSVMLSELFAVYGIPASAQLGEVSLPKTTWPETNLGSNVLPGGNAEVPHTVSNPAMAGRLSGVARSLVFVPQDGREELPGGKPVLSASQVETYLDCPYKWFSLRRLRLGTVDAGHTGMEMGTFAHRVMEVTHRELLARALEAQHPGVDRAELLAQIEAQPACHVPGSRIDEANLEAACAALDLEFDLHQQHMYMVRRPRLAQQLLIAHDSAERAQEDRLKDDLLSSLHYQTRILEGFEPRLFEWSFGRHGNLVEYAGAYFTGTVDRIDVSPHGTAVIIDYKHKSPVGFAAEYDALQPGVAEGELLPNRVQSLIYAQVVRRAFEGRLRLVGSVYLSTKSPHALAGVADENVVDQVFGRVSAKRLPRVSVPRAASGESGMNDLLDRTEELVAKQVEEMLAGNVEARPRDAHSCDFCPVMQCERRMAR